MPVPRLIFIGPWGMLMVNAIAGGGVAATRQRHPISVGRTLQRVLTRIVLLRGEVQRGFSSGCVEPGWFCPVSMGATRCAFTPAIPLPRHGIDPCLVARRLQRRPRLSSRSRADADPIQRAQGLETRYAAR